MINELNLDLACGINKPEGYYGIDLIEQPGVDCVMDLQKYPWDIASESAELINCSHYMEHIKHDNVALDLSEILAKSNSFEEFKANINDASFLRPVDGLIKFMNEVYRILKPGGRILIVCPYYTSVRAFGDPSHVRFINDMSFSYFNKQWRESANIPEYGINCNFDIKLSYRISNDMALKSEEVRQKAFVHDWNTIEDIIVELTKI